MFINKFPTIQQKLSKWKNCLESNQCIDYNKWNHKNRHLFRNLLQTCAGSKSICPVWIRPTENLLPHPRTSFSINELWSNKYDTHKSTIKKNKDGTKTSKKIYEPKKNWWTNNRINRKNLYRFNCSLRNEE